MKKNEGFSLIELIVTVAVMAILSAGVVTIVLSRSGREANSASQKISTVLSETRAQALAKENAWMMIKYDSGRGAYVIETSYSGDMVLGKKFDISFVQYREVGAGETVKKIQKGSVADASSVSELILSYDRASGAFRPIIKTVRGSVGADGSLYEYLSEGGINCYCKTITVSAGTAYQYELTLFKETGRNELKKIS